MSAPLPPADLSRRDPQLLTLARGRIVHRFFPARQGLISYDPIFFDKSQEGRLNAPDGSYGVLYVAREVEGAFAETFLRRPGLTLIDDALLRRKAYVRLKVTSRLRLIKLAGPGLAMLGATAEVVHGGLPYDVSQAWSKALSEHPKRADGIAYYARHDDEAWCYAIFDRGRDAFVEIERRTDLDQDWFWRLAMRYKVGIAPP